eukprot:CAMPEP_0115501814 /NCGR_PEP_ID=MMETSP0271-20121206/68600_1 /TAXON_ID=71861 /ORGANISM="Scrippsiella trochoidea, Strain CCMP3099" /LENGTH=235 /DNA_ID=CAMNT_0002930777 /DNA_START=385 /DNA_END=1092 /DNA_ORIENTATION=+
MLLFHDANQTAAVLIHLFPPLVMFSLYWCDDRVHEAWPHVFRLNYFNHISLGSIYWNAALFYTAWWVLYAIWLFTCGLHVAKRPPEARELQVPAGSTASLTDQSPRRRPPLDTIFHKNMRDAIGGKISGLLGYSEEDHSQMRETNDFTRKHALVYLLLHALGVYLSIFVSFLCYMSNALNKLALALITGVAVYNAATRYVHYMLERPLREFRAAVRALQEGRPHEMGEVSIATAA